MNQTHYRRDKNRSKWRRIGATSLLVILILAFLGLITVYSQIPTSSDFLKFYSSIKFLLNKQSIYTPLTLVTIPGDIPIEPNSFKLPIHPT